MRKLTTEKNNKWSVQEVPQTSVIAFRYNQEEEK